MGYICALAAERHRFYCRPLLILIGNTNRWRPVNLVVRLGTGTKNKISKMSCTEMESYDRSFLGGNGSLDM